MSRLLLLVALLLVILWALQRGAQGRRRQTRDETPRATDPSSDASRTIVPCAHCGVHLPRAEAIEADGRMYCSHAHASLARHGDR